METEKPETTINEVIIDDQRFYDEGKYFVGKFSFTKRWIKNLFNEYSLGMVGNMGRGFLKGRVFGEYKLQMTKIKIILSLYKSIKIILFYL